MVKQALCISTHAFLTEMRGKKRFRGWFYGGFPWLTAEELFFDDAAEGRLVLGLCRCRPLGALRMGHRSSAAGTQAGAAGVPHESAPRVAAQHAQHRGSMELLIYDDYINRLYKYVISDRRIQSVTASC